MPTYGWTNPSFVSWRFTGFNTDNNVAAQGNMPASGTVTGISFYCGGRLQAINAQGCLWTPGGALLVATGVISVPQGSTSTGGQSWNTGSCSLHLNQGTPFLMGWWRNPASGSDCVWSYGSGGSENQGTTANSTGAGPFNVDTTLAEQIGVYITYTPDSAPPPPTQPVPQQPIAAYYKLMTEGLLPK